MPSCEYPKRIHINWIRRTCVYLLSLLSTAKKNTHNKTAIYYGTVSLHVCLPLPCSEKPGTNAMVPNLVPSYSIHKWTTISRNMYPFYVWARLKSTMRSQYWTAGKPLVKLSHGASESGCSAQVAVLSLLCCAFWGTVPTPGYFAVPTRSNGVFFYFALYLRHQNFTSN